MEADEVYADGVDWRATAENLQRELDAMRRRAERIIWLADTSPGYGKGRGQAAREILGEA